MTTRPTATSINGKSAQSVAKNSPKPQQQIAAPAHDEEQERDPNEPWHQQWVERFFTPPPPVDPLKKNGRLYFALIVFLFAISMVLFKLFKIQVLDHEEFSAAAASQYKMQVPIPAKRGVIRDRHGVILASNAFVVKFAVDPQSLKNPETVAKALAATFDKPASHYLEIFKDPKRRYIVLEREVPQEIAAKLDSVKDKGLIREVESRRHYAFDDRASHILGFASKDGRGLAGVELISNKALAGENGFTIMQRDGRGQRRPDVDYEQVQPTHGDDVTLTIDEAVQSVTEAALKAGVDKAKAQAGTAIVMSPKTGEILALANYPDFDPNQFTTADNNMLRNRAITDAYEPGSTIKILTAAMALEEGVMKPETKIHTEGGTWTIDGNAKIRDTHPYGVLTFRESIEKSSNVAFAKISDKIEKNRFYKYLRDFGFGVVSGIDLPGEVKGYVRKPARWGSNSKRYMAFGYEITNTCLQMATAYNTIANMGVMMKPHVIARRVRPDGEVVGHGPQEIRRVVSEQTCKTLISMMTGVVDSGTATTAKIKGVSIAGKTGTAQQLVNGRYSKEHYTSSFTGFFPAENPEYTILVILRSPRNGYYGGAVSAPIFREIAMRLLEMNGKLPPEARAQQVAAKPAVDEGGIIEIEGTILNRRADEEAREMPEVRGLSVEAGKLLLASQGFTVIAPEKGVIERVEKRGADSVRFIVMKNVDLTGKRNAQPVPVPNFIGMTVGRAMKVGTMNNMQVRVIGEGMVLKQFPEAGAALDKNNPVITLFGEE
ncbi:MAG TPA: penicillin-binding transpeptidase domain-containing protein [Candidatus Kapabacteria bacterium]|nr:penicillin-binding transpeptidase domain-containing protein [Candidatus Kapabacteria bacterium]